MSTLDQVTSSAGHALPEATSRRDIMISVSRLDDLFNAPSANPFTDRDLRALGEPALSRALRELQSDGLRDHRPVRLRIEIPAAQLPSNIGPPEVREAIHRYCVARITDNTAMIHVTRRRARRGLQIALALVLAFAALAYVLLSTVLAHAGSIIQAFVVGMLSVFTWVVLWDTLEAWIFNPIPMSFENRALARLQRADVAVNDRPD